LITCSAYTDNSATSFDGVNITYDTKGEGKPALVFVHGWANNRSIWNDQVTHFSDRYRVVTIDLAGFGESASNRQEWTMSSFGEDIKAVVQKLDLDQVVLVGFSMGGSVVIEAASLLSESNVGVVLVDAIHNPEMRYPPEVAKQRERDFMELVTKPPKEKEKMSFFFRNNQEESLQRVLSMINKEPKTGWRESLVENMRWRNEDCAASLSKINCPVVAIKSDQRVTSSEVFRKYVPDFEVKIINDVGHVVMWDAPEEFNRLLEETIQEFMNK
jgi:pimeloyl-ACP methyl ester carboxylesterase